MNPNAQFTAIPELPNQAGQANVPGIRQLWLIETRHVTGVLDPRTIRGGQITTWQLPNVDILLTTDAVVHSFQFPFGRGSYEQKPTVSVHGVTYSHTLTLDVPKDHAQTALLVQRMTGRKWLAIVQDGNGNLKLVGTLKQPLRFVAQFKSNPNGYSFTWVGETREPSWFVQLITTELFPYAEFDASFDYSFTS